MNSSDPSAASPTIAIIGSGPSGCYAAQFLGKQWPDAEIVIFDCLDLPYGLVRYGVAPDHQGTKAVSKQFDRLFEREAVTFVGGTEIGSEITLAAVRAAFDIVILATGLPADRELEVQGARLPGVFGAGAITRLINGHPNEGVDWFRLGQNVTIVGQGNVAFDLVRLFLTPPDRLLALGVASAVADAIARGPVRSIEIVGRSGAAAAKFDLAMAKELGKLADVRFLADGLPNITHATDVNPRVAVIDELVAGTRASEASRLVHFRFGFTPRQVNGAARVESITFDATDGCGKQLNLATDSVCTAIGFLERTDAALRRADLETASSDLERGRLDDGLYCVGWLRRGPQGTIPTNRVDSRMVVDEIIAAVTSGALRVHKPGYRSIQSPALIKEPS